MKREWLNKAFCLFACLMLLLALLPGGASAADVVASGECGADGDNLTWTLDSDGVLTVSGTGAMLDFGTFTPWYDYSESITAVRLSAGVTSIGEFAFSNCDSMTSVTIPDSVTSIGDFAFFGSSGLTSVTIPSSVTSIGHDAFEYCNGLTSVTIPDSVTSIGESAFARMSNLTEVNVASGNQAYCSVNGVLFDKNQTTLMVYPSSKQGAYSIPDSVTRIADDAFYGCRGLTSVTVPDSVTSIGNGAFSDCIGLTSVTIPSGVTIIGDIAFAHCNGLTSVTIPSGVTRIGEQAFAYCTGLTNVTIPDSVTWTGYGVFQYCTNLTSVTIPSGVTTISNGAFEYCTGLTSVTIPDSVTGIDDWAFAGCTGLTSVTIPDSVTIIGESAFSECTGLTSMMIPSGVTMIDDYAFAYCTGLTSVTIQTGVETISTAAFCDCSGLKSVTIPSSVTRIGWSAFSGCSSLTDVYYGGSEADWAAIVFGSENKPLRNATIHYNSSGGEVPPIKEEDEGQTSAVEFRYEHTLPTATQYVPYQEAIPASLSGGSFALTSGSLPAGLSLSADGVLSGFPEELGVFSFTVTETAGDSSVEHVCSLSTYSRMYADVEASNPPGYGFVETEGDDGRVQDQTVSSVDELTDQVMHCQGPFPQFRNLYLDGRRLVRDVEYRAEEGSTKITIYAETIGEEGGGTHTLAAEFETDDGETVYTVQNYTVYGIASTDVHVEVTGEVVIWTDAEPYIDTNSRTMTPFRVVGDALGLTIAWDSAAREASFSDGTRTIYFPIGSTAARTSEGTTVEMDTSAVIVNGRTYAPVRYLAQYFGYSVGWDAPTRTVKIG